MKSGPKGFGIHTRMVFIPFLSAAETTQHEAMDEFFITCFGLTVMNFPFVL